jgi:6,7-dimethyl-8-ribityllumazine synthase
MIKTIEGMLDAKGLKFAIIASRFNDFVVSKLVDGAVDCIVRHGGMDKDLTIIKVPGAFELVLAAKKAALSKKYDGIICVGAVIRGATPHFEYVAAETSKGIAHVNMETNIPVGFGVLTCENLEQAIERSGSKAGNKGVEAAMATLEMVNVLKQI